jgi:hypothetical protein
MSKFGLTGQTATDLSPASKYQNTVAGQSVALPKILVWGNESYPILWRLVGTYAGDNTSDDQGANLASDVANIYNTIANGEEVMSWINIGAHGFHQWRKDKWEEGRNWANTDSNDGWRHVIGANWTEYIPTTYWENTCTEEHYYNFCDTQPDPEACRSYCIITYPWGYNVYHDLPSDGVVTYESATNSGGSWQDYAKEALNNLIMVNLSELIGLNLR